MLCLNHNRGISRVRMYFVKVLVTLNVIMLIEIKRDWFRSASQSHTMKHSALALYKNLSCVTDTLWITRPNQI